MSSAEQGRKGRKDKGGQMMLVRRKRRRHHDDEGAHGGWKVAYADFVTALMTFFLLMWLVKATDDEQRKAISEYFNPYQREAEATKQTQGGVISIFDGGKMGGDDVQARDQENAQARGAVDDAPPPPVAEAARERPDPEAHRQWAKDREEEERRLAEVREGIGRMIEKMPELRGLSENLLIEETPEGLRIQIVDKDEFSMFQVGSSNVTPRARLLLQGIGRVAAGVPNRVSVSGHTDGLRYAGRSTYSNWELSADRANAARRVLAESGVEVGKFARVEGRADTDHLVKDNPNDQRNRRISILLLRNHAEPPAPDGARPAPARAPRDDAQVIPRTWLDPRGQPGGRGR